MEDFVLILYKLADLLHSARRLLVYTRRVELRTTVDVFLLYLKIFPTCLPSSSTPTCVALLTNTKKKHY